MTLSNLLRSCRSAYVVVRDSLTGECLFQGTETSVLHSANCDDYLVEYCTPAIYGTNPVLYVEVI